MMQGFQCLACKGVYFDSSPDGATYFHVCPPLPRDDKGVRPVRVDARDENLTQPRAGRAQSIRSEGAGVKCLTNAKLQEPAWITALKKRAAKEEED